MLTVLPKPNKTAYRCEQVITWIEYWLGLPFRWAYQMGHNGNGIACVLDLTRFRPLTAGLVSLDHPWVTGINPSTNKTIWQDNVIYRTERAAYLENGLADEKILYATGKFLAERVRQSAVVPELPTGPKRRMPHAINYLHGTSHYNSGIIVLNDLDEAFKHITDRRFQREIYRFVRQEHREVLFVFRNRDYSEQRYADLSCCMRSVFPWFCNPNGPKRKVLWGNYAPYPAANLITGNWIRDLYLLKTPSGSEQVARPAISEKYFQQGPYDRGRSTPTLAELTLSRSTQWRVSLRGAKEGMFFVDRRKVYADQLAKQRTKKTENVS